MADPSQLFNFDFSAFLSAFLLLFAIMDPFATVPVFIALTKKFKSAEKAKAADSALVVAAVVIMIFLFFGTLILDFFKIHIDDFKIAGGIVLGILGLQIVLGLDKSEKSAKDYHVAAAIIGVPLITGPGVITSTIVLVNQSGVFTIFLAAICALFLNWLIIRQSERIYKLLGDNPIEILSKIMGLLLIAVAIGFIRAGFGGA